MAWRQYDRHAVVIACIMMLLAVGCAATTTTSTAPLTDNDQRVYDNNVHIHVNHNQGRHGFTHQQGTLSSRATMCSSSLALMLVSGAK